MNVVAEELTNTTATILGDVVPDWLTKSSVFTMFLQSMIMSGVMGGIAAVMSLFYIIAAWIKYRFWIVVEVPHNSPLYDVVLAALSTSNEMNSASSSRAIVTIHNDTSIKTNSYLCNKSNYIWRPIASEPYILTYKGRRIWVSHNEVLKPGLHNADARYKFVFECYGTNKEFIQDLIIGFAETYKASHASCGTLSMCALAYLSGCVQWVNLGKRIPRSMSSIIIPDEMRLAIENDIDRFLNNTAWYTKRGIPYRRGYLLYGPPGTGKTSFVNAIAGRTKMNIYIIHLTTPELTDQMLIHRMSSMSCRAIFLLEDMDAAFCSDRIDNDDSARKSNTGITASGLLNALDGVAAQEGSIIIITTNHKNRLDPALIRPGRIDMEFHFDLATKESARRLFIQFYEDDTHADEFADAVPEYKFSIAELQGYMMNYQSKPKKAIKNFRTFLAAKQ